MHISIKIRLIFVLLFIGVLPFRVFASHIVGGGFTYRFLGDTVVSGDTIQKYQVTMDLYQDCLSGVPDAIAQDDPVYIAIYEAGSTTLFLHDSIYYDKNPNSGNAISIPASVLNSTSAIANANLQWCLLRKRFTRVYYLPKNNTGYVVVHQRCCRNRNIINIANAGDVGLTLSCTIPPGNIPNNSAVFTANPPGAICINKAMVFYDTATDADGDSLSYEYSESYNGGNSLDIKPRIPLPPPFDVVNYSQPNSATSPMTGQPGLAIDAASGKMTATPDRIGRYMINMVCKEWRNGQMINVNRKDFELLVINCDVLDVSTITAPNVFTPNGDGLNDVLNLIHVGRVTLNNFRVYDRWGKLLYQSSNIYNGWDGTYNGKDEPTGVYTWSAEYDDNGGTPRVTSGNVTLLR